MLRSFRLGNHRSFRDEHELLLMPTYSKDRLVLPVAAIYGANASGKSNLLDGLRFMAEAVRDSFGVWKSGAGVPRHPFKLDPEARGRSSVFVVELVLDGVRYTYGFEIDDSHVREEWLYSYPEKRRRVLFERAGGAFKFGAKLDRKSFWDDAVDFMNPEGLFLSFAGKSTVEPLATVYKWFTSRLLFRLDVGSVDEAGIIEFLQGDSAVRNEVISLARAADFGISDVLTVEEGLAPDVEVRVELRHGVSDERFDLADESAGTRSWLSMLPAVVAALRDGRTLVIDELDTSLHPLLAARLVGLFHDPATNANDAQLIFTTHDATLLHPPYLDQVLDRDEVWFAEKDDTGASDIYPLTDFKPRNEENLERRYLAGRYGAVPTFFEEDFAAAVRGDSESA
ncbi:ATP/GTP-binding protein [Lentzea sp. NPDC051213]|uniref:ATP/GTP-binding protein n=1 Tax=Lentzea sp. NPDC051213 TaxID=3364126 RepID=UPI0037A958A7